MAAPPHILLLDDGELDDVVALLHKLELEHTRHRGGEILSDIAPPLDLLIATPRRASSVREGSAEGSKPGRPVRVIVTEEDSNAMRQMMRRAGYHMLVRRPTHPEIWRLLIQRAIYQGDERRRDARIAIGSDVRLAQQSDSSLDHLALLLDISLRGCRISSCESLSEGSIVTVSIPASPADGRSIELTGEVVRCAPSGNDSGDFNTALTFSPLPSETRERLQLLLDEVEKDLESLSSSQSAVAALPAEDQDTAESGAVAANLEVCVRTERRQQQRGAYTQSVLAQATGHTSVLMGRDLSAGGMRVERLSDLNEGDRFTLAIYGPARAEPLQIKARVSRDDGEEGLMLRFDDVSEQTSRELEKLVAALPDVEFLDSSESESMGAVLSEIVASSND